MTNELRDRTVLVTGASAGIGRATATALARMGANVLMASRSRERGEAAVRAIADEVSGARLHLLLADLSTIEGVRSLADQTLAASDRLDVLVNNAGLYTRQRESSSDGFEMQFAVNHLAPFLLTALLSERLEASAPARIVMVSSEAHRRGRIDFDDIHGERRYSGLGAYTQSKLANLLFTRERARRLSGTGVTANAAHPGVVATRLLFEGFGPLRLLGPFLKTPEQGARTIVHVASAPALERLTGLYFIDGESARPSARARDDDTARRLWDLSARLTGIETTENRTT
ncbi:MAG: SDR family oxidoreductase [marine benthic group bacterium]|nr:SDR family oxidoreductase [Gemmatimonadota bacterium]